jgi:hypothetical protein
MNVLISAEKTFGARKAISSVMIGAGPTRHYGVS